ncbi:hypothetical protein GBA52_025959 [Prunus armeniaca]|nr:hypothetical protein GBA52_025959 [Prunus armeniaca]
MNELDAWDIGYVRHDAHELLCLRVYEFPSKKTTNAAKANPKYLSRYSRLTVPKLGILCCFINLTHLRF